MKKYFFCALAVAGLLSSCSSDDSVSDAPGIQTSDELVPIHIGVKSAPISAATRAVGTGTVGDIATGSNVWANQKINVYMLNKGTTDMALFDGIDIFNNATFIAPASVEATSADNMVGALTEDQSIKYYPPQGYYDFWGYRLDGAEATDPVISDTQIAIPFVIDGSQDVMVAKAVPTAADSALLRLDGNGNPADAATANLNVQRVYSAFAARRGVQPTLDFKHMLTRLKFFISAGDALTCDAERGIFVDSIKVMSKATGNLIAAYTGDELIDQVVFDDAAALDSLTLRQRIGNNNDANLDQPLETLTPIQPVWNVTENKTDTVRVGESLIVAPADQYELRISISQRQQVSRDPSLDPADQFRVLKNTYVVPLTTPSGTAFKRGYSYNVYMTMWGFSRITVNTTLQPWVEDDADSKIEILPEDFDSNSF